MKRFTQLLAVIPMFILLLTPAIAEAHVIVTPSTVGIGQELTFNVSVPNERDTPVTEVELVIPTGVTAVVPSMNGNWNIATAKSSNGDVSRITWEQGSIPVGERTDFSFSAQAPGTSTSLHWKAFQTYADGTVVHWDETPNGTDDSVGTAGPYSVTVVKNDLTSTPKSPSTLPNIIALGFSIVALLLSIGMLLFQK